MDSSGESRCLTVGWRESYNVEIAEVIGGSFWKPYTPVSITALKAKVLDLPRVGESNDRRSKGKDRRCSY